MTDHTEEALAAILKLSTPELVRENLIRAALLITAYEALSDAITTNPLGFFARDFTADGPKESDDYRSKVRSLHKRRFEASCIWFRDNGAIDDTDLSSIYACRDHRNAVVHELMRFLVEPASEVRLDLLDEIVRIQKKIDRWWIMEIEIPTNPDFDGVDVDQNEVRGGMSLVFEIIRDVALSAKPAESKGDA